MHISRFKLVAFKKWLSDNGFQILANTSEWEIVRWRSGFGTGIVYKNKLFNLTFNDHASIAYKAFFKKGLSWPAPEKERRKKLDILTRTILERDGDLCFYCALIMPPDDMTREHLLAVNSGGINHIDNLVLAHRACNQRAGHLPVIKKVLLRDQLRGKL